MEKKRMKYRQRQNFFKTDAWKRFRKNKLALVGTAVILLLILVAVFAPVIAQNDPYVSLQDGSTVLKNMSPSKSHTILGTDSIGRDGFSRLVYAARVSMSVGLVAVGISTVIGIVLGAIAGYFGGVADTIIMRCVDVVNCFPVLFLIIIVATILKPSIYNVMIIIGLCNWTGTARLVRGEILRVREMEYVQAAVSLGATDFRIIFSHVIPNVLAPIIVEATMQMARAILTEASLSYLGCGVQLPTDKKTVAVDSGRRMYFPGSAEYQLYRRRSERRI